MFPRIFNTRFVVFAAVLLIAPSQARADIPWFDFDLEQNGDNVELRAWTAYHEYAPECSFAISRRSGSGDYQLIFEGGLSGDQQCFDPDGGVGMRNCRRTCSTYEDHCPPPGDNTYRLERRFFDPTPGFSHDEQVHDISFAAENTTCEYPKENLEGCNCRNGLGRAKPHLLVLLILLLGWLVPRAFERHNR